MFYVVDMYSLNPTCNPFSTKTQSKTSQKAKVKHHKKPKLFGRIMEVNMLTRDLMG